MVQQLEEQMERIRERLERPQPSRGGWFGLLAGVGLGALVGGALAFFLRSREEEPLYAPPPPPPPAPPRRDDAVLLRAAPATPSAPAAAEEDDEPIVLKSPSAPATPPAEEPAASADEAPSGSAAATTEAEAAPAVEESVEPAKAPTETDDTDELTDEEVMDAPVAEFYANAVAPADGQCPASHPVKGNINRNGQLIFHTPDSNNYARVNAEACFANEEDAEAAGFRKSRS